MQQLDEEIIDKLQNVTGVKYSEEQLKILNHHGGMCILACAGSGKTTILTHLLAKRMLTGEIRDTSKVLCTTYSKTGATEMDNRLAKLIKKVGIKSKLTVKTMHAFYLMILKACGYPTDVIEGGLRLKFINSACKDAKIALGEDDLQLIDSLLSYQINNLLSDEELVKSYVFTLENVTLEQYTAVRMGYAKRKQEKHLIDFDDMQLYMYALLVKNQDAGLINYCRSLFTDFYIDEAQDISKIQFEILRTLITDPSKIVFIGDDDQSIYKWRGADPDIILNICGYYDIDKFILSTNYRCFSEIVDPAAVGITHNKYRAEKQMQAYNQGGKIQICDTKGGSLYNITKYAYMHIKKLVKEQNVDPENIAVLSRNNQHLALLNNMLFRDGIYCDAAPEMRFTHSSMYRDMRNVIELSGNNYNYSITASTLWRVCIFLGVKSSLFISKFQSSAGIKLSDAIGYILTKYGHRSDVDWNGTLKIPATADARVEYFYNTLQSQTVDYLAMIYKLLTDDDANVSATGLLNLYLSASAFMYKTDDRIRSITGFVEYTTDMIHSMGVDKLKTFFKVTEQYEEGRMAIPGSKVCMSTMHGSKGREWEHVVLFADDNITFPSFNGIAKMIQNGVSFRDIASSIDEERRLHYVATTRAKLDLTIFTDSHNVSVFLLECMNIFNPQDADSDMHITSMASNGELYDTLVEDAQKQLFDENSKYYYNIDISGLKYDYGVEQYVPVNNTGDSISLDSIQTSNSSYYDE